jgi:hypothetical protein
VVFALVFVLRAAKAINPDSGFTAADPKNKQACVETYGITLNLSEYYVREWQLGDPALQKRDDKTPELSTVLRGMARNGCGEDVKNVRIKMVVHDDAGKKGEGFYFIESMAVGEVKAFEKAWMGKVASYEVTTNR